LHRRARRSARPTSASASPSIGPATGRATSAFGVVSGAILYLWQGQPNLLFHFVIGSMIVSQIAEYAFQLALFRRAA